MPVPSPLDTPMSGMSMPAAPVAPAVQPLKAPAADQDMLDYDQTRSKVFGGVMTALQTKYPIENENYQLRLDNLRYDGPEHYSLKEQKQAILERKTLARSIKGTWNLMDKKTGQAIDSYKSTVCQVPYLTQRGTYILNGSEYTVARQMRLKSGVYSRKKENGEYEAHVNVLKGGPGFRVFMEPDTGVFRMQIGQAKLRLYPVMRAMGVSDQDMQKRWGADIFNANMTASDGKGTLDKVWERLADARSKKETGENVEKDFKALFNKLELDPEVTQRTLGERHDRITPEAIGRITSKLMNISKGAEDTDDRDSLAYQETWSAPDLLHERIIKDAGRIGSRLLWRATLRKSLSGMPSSALNPQLDSLFYKSGLSQPLEEINPLDSMDQNMRVTRLGEGGIGSDESVPEDARAVQPSHFNFIDSVRSPECHDEQTEVMTSTGWKAWTSVTLNDDLACLISGKVEYHKPLKLIVEPYVGEMIRLTPYYSDLLVTPNHKLWLVSSIGWQFIDASKLTEAFCVMRALEGKLEPNDSRWAPSTVAPSVDIVCDATKDKSTVHYSGMVYCAEVPGHLLYTRRGNSMGIWSGNSGSVGIDLRLASNTRKGDDKQLHSTFTDLKTGQPVSLNPHEAIDATIAFPGELSKAVREGHTHVRAMRGGRMSYVNTKDVQYEAPSAQGMFTHGSNLVPMASGMKPGRLLMAAKYALQALPLKEGEAPLVQSTDEAGVSYYDKLAKHVGAVRSEQGGQVVGVSRDSIQVKGADGQVQTHDLYDMHPLNRKTFLHNTPVVKVGDVVQPGALIAKSNMTDAKGTMALGKNMRVGYVPYKGGNFEDGIIVSESAAHKMASEHMYTHSIDKDDFSSTGRNKFMSVFPSVYTKAQLNNIAEDGVALPGTVVNKGDPLILSVKERTSKGAGMLYHGNAPSHQDGSVTWDHDFPGKITDRWNDEDGVKVAVQAYAPCEQGDKLSSRYAAKGVISRVVPDKDMPVSEDGKPLEILMSPLGVVTRVNPNQVVEAILGKVAEKRGQPYMVPTFSDKDWIDFAMEEAKKYGVKDTEDVYDPSIKRTIPKVLVGRAFFQKLSHTAESKVSSRGTGAYTSEGMPAADDEGNPKRIGLGEMQALLSHGATANIQEIKNIRGQRNDDYWQALTLGQTPPSPQIPAAYKKFTALLQGAGINVKKKGEHLHLTSMTDRDVDSMSSGEITEPTTVRWMTDYGRGLKGEKSLDPVEGGLFDRGITGGHGGCFHGSTLVTTDKGEMSIQNIVEQRLVVNVFSYDWDTGKFVYRPVTNWFTNYSDEGIGHAEFGRATYGGVDKYKDTGKTVLWGTRGHQVYCVDGCKRDLSAADYLLTCDELLTSIQEQVVLGGLLGDAHINKWGMYSETHCAKQKCYLAWKHDVLKNFCYGPVKPRTGHHDYKGKRVYKLQYALRTKTHAAFKKLRLAFYPMGVKYVAREHVAKLDALGLAVWYMDDGSICCHRGKNTRYIALCTHGFTLDDVQYLQQLLLSKWNIQSRVDRDEKLYAGREQGWMLAIVGTAADLFLDIVAPFIHPTMLYKLGTRPTTGRCVCGKEIWVGREVCNTCLIAQVKLSGEHKLGNHIRRRLGGTALAREMAAGLQTIPDEVTRCERHDNRVLVCGSQLSSLVTGTEQPKVLVRIPAEYHWRTGKSYERTRQVYDIEVADTHTIILLMAS